MSGNKRQNVNKRPEFWFETRERVETSGIKCAVKKLNSKMLWWKTLAGWWWMWNKGHSVPFCAIRCQLQKWRCSLHFYFKRHSGISSWIQNDWSRVIEGAVHKLCNTIRGEGVNPCVMLWSDGRRSDGMVKWSFLGGRGSILGQKGVTLLMNDPEEDLSPNSGKVFMWL